MKNLLLLTLSLWTFLCFECFGQRVLVPLDSMIEFSNPKFAEFWVDTLGAGFPNNRTLTATELYPRLHTTLPSSIHIFSEILDLSILPNIGDTIRRTMLKQNYYSWYDSLMLVANEFGGATMVLTYYTNTDSNNYSHWKIYFVDTISTSKFKLKIEGLFPDSAEFGIPAIRFYSPDPFAGLLSVNNSGYSDDYNIMHLNYYPITRECIISLSEDDLSQSYNSNFEIYDITGKLLWYENVFFVTSTNKRKQATIVLPERLYGFCMIKYNTYIGKLYLP